MIRYFTEAIRLDPKFAKAYYKRGNCYGDKGEYDKAIADFTEVIRLDPVYKNRAISYGTKDDKAIAAIVVFTEAIRLNPTNPELYKNRAIAYRKIGDTAKSASDEKKTRELKK